jgi:hypothetical protein
VVQVAQAPARMNKGVCIKTTGLTQSCVIVQSSATANNQAVVYEDAGNKAGLTQTASYTASITQTATGASNTNQACVHQAIALVGNTVLGHGRPVIVTLEAHQSVKITQDAVGGSNSAQDSATSVGGCVNPDEPSLTQTQRLTSIATGTGLITQNENDTLSPCGDGFTGDYANMCLDIEQNQNPKGVGSGANYATFAQTNTLTAVANTPAGPVTQTQSSICPDPPGDCVMPGGLVGTVNQDSSLQSTANATQTETQCEDAATGGLTSCDTNDADASEAPGLTQTQYGPEGLAKFPHKRRGRHFYKTLKGLGTARQTGNTNGNDAFTITQTSKQDDDQGTGSTQTNVVQGDCQTSGTCTDTQTTNINGSTTTTTQSGQDVNTSTNCTGSTCQTSTPPPDIVGNNAALGGGPIQTYDFATGALVNSFVPDGATATNANGRAVMVVGNEVFYTELSGDGFGPSDGIHVAPFNNGAGGSDLRVLPNPAPSTGIQDLAYAGGYLYALTGYYQSPLQVWKLDPLTGSVIGVPISITGPESSADGFTVLPDGNFLINDGDESCTYREYKPSTGLATGTPLSVPGDPSICTGVETDGASLYFQTNFDSFTKTGLNGTLISTTPVASNLIEDISLA